MCVPLHSARGFPMYWKIGSLVGQQVRVVSAIPVDTQRKGFKHISLFLSTCLSTSMFLYTVCPYDRISPLGPWPMTHSASIQHNSNPACVILFIMQSCMASAWYRCTKTKQNTFQPNTDVTVGGEGGGSCACRYELNTSQTVEATSATTFSVLQIYFRFWWTFLTVNKTLREGRAYCVLFCVYIDCQWKWRHARPLSAPLTKAWAKCFIPHCYWRQ